MAVSFATKGFVFRKEDRSDADRDFFVFTESFGRLKIFSKAIRKINSKLRGGIDIFCISDLEFIQGKSKKTLTDACLIRKFDNILSSPKRFEIANRIAEVLDEFVKEQEKDEKIFDLLQNTFEKLNSENLESKSCELLYYYFLFNFFAALGFSPEFYSCTNCSSDLIPSKIYFSCSDGGLICNKCFTQHKNLIEIDQDSAKILRLIIKKDWDTISKLKFNKKSFDSLRDVAQKYYFYLSSK